MEVRELLETASNASGVGIERVYHLPKSPTSVQPVVAGWEGNRAYVLYWAANSLRVQENEALALAIAVAEQLDCPLVALVTINLWTMKSSSLRVISFILEGMGDLANSLASKNVTLHVRIDPNDDSGRGSLSVIGRPRCRQPPRGEESLRGLRDVEPVHGFSKRARIIITDKRWMPRDIEAVEQTARRLNCPMVSVNTQTLFPIGESETSVDDDEGYAAFLDGFPGRVRRSFRAGLPATSPNAPSFESPNLADFGVVWRGTKDWAPSDFSSPACRETLISILKANSINTNVTTLTSTFKGGERRAALLLASFVRVSLRLYGTRLQRPAQLPHSAYGSNLSPYLNAGYISPKTIVAAVLGNEEAAGEHCTPSEVDGCPCTSTKRSSAPCPAGPLGGQGVPLGGDVGGGSAGGPPGEESRGGAWFSSDGSDFEGEASANSQFLQTLGRREWAYRISHFDKRHDEYERAIPQWLRTWLQQRSEADPARSDAIAWDVNTWSRGETESTRWNTVMKQLRLQGLCVYPERVFWSQVIMDYSADAQSAFRTIIALNDLYMLDSFSPSGTASIANSLGRFQTPKVWGEFCPAPKSSTRYSVSTRQLFQSATTFDTVLGATLFRTNEFGRVVVDDDLVDASARLSPRLSDEDDKW